MAVPTPRASRRPRTATALPLVAMLLAACQSAAPPPAPPATASVAALYRQPAERSLLEGIRLYEDAAFSRAEAELARALRAGLADPRDRAVAWKYLAFIACAFERLAECREDFRQAFAADPGFALTATEVGHPVWGPVYREVAAQAK